LGREVGTGDGAADADLSAEERAEVLVLLGEAIERLAEEYPRAARVVDCRVFSGMTIAETAEALDVSDATVSRDWTKAKAWLHREMKRIRGEVPPESAE
jgi:RNA polymerase sigma factor (sigma-70 family)